MKQRTAEAEQAEAAAWLGVGVPSRLTCRTVPAAAYLRNWLAECQMLLRWWRRSAEVDRFNDQAWAAIKEEHEACAVRLRDYASTHGYAAGLVALQPDGSWVPWRPEGEPA